MAKKISLTYGEYAIVDDDIFEYLNQFKWHCLKTQYGEKYAKRDDHRKSILMHRVIMNATPDVEVDHVNGNGLFNLRSNLRICTRAQNGRNRGRQKNNTSGYTGVSWDKMRNSWTAKIKVDGKEIFLGRFKDILEAAKSYQNAASDYFGEFAFSGESSVTIRRI